MIDMDLKSLKFRMTDTNNIRPERVSQSDNSVTVKNVSLVEAHFREIEKVIVRKISSSEAVVGCVAWLTSYAVLDALAKLNGGCSIVLQKEDFLRPDVDHTPTSYKTVRQKYALLKALAPYSYGEFQKSTLEYLDDGGEIADIAIRCVGYRRLTGKVHPLMHHKFLVFLKPEDCGYPPKPYAVWTGSFNMSVNATLSLENGLFIESEELANAYFNEWYNTLMISEELDWKVETPQPTIQYNILDSNVLP
ncbi:hypothetical protein [Pseudomonas sp. NUPR-001]|uniref:hypothetical protein n=1 Tax=Pseudomonas sp. NUPR-001 TaxID=3416058 RepID=UPI003F997B6A